MFRWLSVIPLLRRLTDLFAIWHFLGILNKFFFFMLFLCYITNVFLLSLNRCLCSRASYLLSNAMTNLFSLSCNRCFVSICLIPVTLLLFCPLAGVIVFFFFFALVYLFPVLSDCSSFSFVLLNVSFQRV